MAFQAQVTSRYQESTSLSADIESARFESFPAASNHDDALVWHAPNFEYHAHMHKTNRTLQSSDKHARSKMLKMA